MSPLSACLAVFSLLLSLNQVRLQSQLLFVLSFTEITHLETLIITFGNEYLAADHIALLETLLLGSVRLALCLVKDGALSRPDRVAKPVIPDRALAIGLSLGKADTNGGIVHRWQ